MDKFDYNNSSDELFSVETIEDDVPVTCLGLEFKNDNERKEYFLNLLAEKLKDPEFRKIEGFPIGLDEDILALSDPPYYCACPNPWLNDFIEEWEYQKPYKPANWFYKREPFVSDVSEGKNDPIYTAHSYHTKVPYKAVMRYILHYTEPGDIIYDGFCGSGMTGIAAQLCGVKEEVEALGYFVDDNGIIYESKEGVYSERIPFSRVGKRCAVLNDLSPYATSISDCYNSPIRRNFINEVENIINELTIKYGEIYETKHNGDEKGIINYTVWSEVCVCPNCGKEFVLYNSVFSLEKGKVEYNAIFNCPHCYSKITRGKEKGVPQASIAWETIYDEISHKTTQRVKRVPVLINYSVGKSRFNKTPDEEDIEKCNWDIQSDSNLWFPTNRMKDGDESRRNDSLNILRVDQFYVPRARTLIAKFKQKCTSKDLEFLLGSILPKMTILNRFMPQHGSRALVGPMANTLYVPPIFVENNFLNQIEFHSKKVVQGLKAKWHNIISTQAIQSLNLQENIDYIFLDPPFGNNIAYSELSYIRESWIKVLTNDKLEAIENKTQGKGIFEYRKLMADSFKSAYKALKPGHWITVEFSNTSADVWNSIQTTLSDSGFIISSVNALDKKRGGLHAMIGPTAVKEDLVITAYKPDTTFISQVNESNGEEGVWSFIRKHLEYLPVVKESGIEMKSYTVVPEREPRILYDRLVSYYVGHNILLPISSPDFIAELDKHFIERDGLYYLPDQVALYDKLKALNKIGEEDTSGSLFVHDESSAIAWIREQLKKKTMTTGEMTPLFMQELNSWDKNEKRLELAELLEENFLRYDGIGDVPSPIHSYLSTNYKELRNMDKDNPALVAKAKGRWYVPDPNKQADLEKLREKGLLKEFNGYLQIRGKLKEFRLEAVRAGFKKAWSDKDYKLILDFASRIPSNIIEEDPKLLMWYNGALTRLEK